MSSETVTPLFLYALKEIFLIDLAKFDNESQSSSFGFLYGFKLVSKGFKVFWKECYNELVIHNVNLKGTILKPNMILPGNKSNQKATSAEIAKKTLKCLKENVPHEVHGIAFLSGGQT